MSSAFFVTLQLANIPYKKLPEVVCKLSLIAVKKNKNSDSDTDHTIMKNTPGYFMHNNSQPIDLNQPMDNDIAYLLTRWASNVNLLEDQYKFLVNLLTARKAFYNIARDHE
jgi:hypothetical protein